MTIDSRALEGLNMKDFGKFGNGEKNVITVMTVKEVEKLETEGYHVVTDSDLGTGGEL